MASKKKNKGLLLLLLLIPIGLIARKLILNKMSKAFPLPPEPNKKPALISIPESEPSKILYYKAKVFNVGTKGLNVRQNINTNSDILYKLKNNTEIAFAPIGSRDWVAVKYKNNEGDFAPGFVAKKYLKTTNEIYKF